MTDPSKEALALIDELRRIVPEPGHAHWFNLNLLEGATRIDRFASERIESVLLEPSEEVVRAAAVANWDFDAEGGAADCFDDLAPWQRDAYLDCARAALKAAALSILARVAELDAELAELDAAEPPEGSADG